MKVYDTNGNQLISYGLSVNTIDGWIPVSATWTRASAVTITVPAGAGNIYSIGDKLKVTDTTVKYFYIVGVADTLLTITGGTSYTLAGNPSNIFYSKSVSPTGFPQWFNYNTLGANLNLGEGSVTGRFSITGRNCNFSWLFIGGNGSGIAANLHPALPIPAANPTGNNSYQSFVSGQIISANASRGWNLTGVIVPNVNTTGIHQLSYTLSSEYYTPVTVNAPFTFGASDELKITGFYEI